MTDNYGSIHKKYLLKIKELLNLLPKLKASIDQVENLTDEVELIEYADKFESSDAKLLAKAVDDLNFYLLLVREAKYEVGAFLSAMSEEVDSLDILKQALLDSGVALTATEI